MYSQWSWSARGALDVKKVFSYINTQFPYSYDETSFIAPVRCSREGMFAFDTCSLFWNVPYKRVHTTEGTALSRSWNKRPTAIVVSV